MLVGKFFRKKCPERILPGFALFKLIGRAFPRVGPCLRATNSLHARTVMARTRECDRLRNQIPVSIIEKRRWRGYVCSTTFLPMEEAMAWSTPCVTEVCVGMEVTSYESAEI